MRSREMRPDGHKRRTDGSTLTASLAAAAKAGPAIRSNHRKGKKDTCLNKKGTIILPPHTRGLSSCSSINTANNPWATGR
jgi:hypothetical protein